MKLYSTKLKYSFVVGGKIIIYFEDAVAKFFRSSPSRRYSRVDRKGDKDQCSEFDVRANFWSVWRRGRGVSEIGLDRPSLPLKPSGPTDLPN